MPVSLEILNLSGGESFWARHKFTGGIPVEWSSMTNLKELKMANCGLDGQCFNVESNHPCAQLMRTFRMLRGVCYARARLLLRCSRDKRVFSVSSQGTSRPRSRSARRCSRSISRSIRSKVRVLLLVNWRNQNTRARN